MRTISLVALSALLCVNCNPVHSAYIPRDLDLLRQPLYFYPDAGASRHPKAAVFFLGNDFGFLGPHRELSQRLASHGYAVVGFDVNAFLDRLPASGRLRDSILVHDVPRLIKRALHELGADRVPLIIAGHSFGADIALWTEAHARLPGVVGVLALNPTMRDHLMVTINDRMNIGEPAEPGSFAVDEQIRNIPANVRIALLRGASDKERTSDRAFIGAGGSRLTYTVIPFASHSLNSLVRAGPMIERALDRLVAGR